MSRFNDRYKNIMKAPDMATVPGDRFWPIIVFDLGYAEPYEQLKADTQLLLEGH